MLQVSQKDVTVGGSFNRHGGYPAGNTDSAQYGQRAPAACRNAFIQACAAQDAAIAPRHLRGDAALVEEDEPRRIDLPGGFLPELPLRPDPLGVLLGGMDRLFLRRRPIRFSTSHS